MAGRQCEQCAALNRSLNNEDQPNDSPVKREASRPGFLFPSGRRTDDTPDSADTRVGTHQNGSAVTSNGSSEKSGHPDKDEEKGGESDPPEPVGLFHSSLSKVRLQILGLWARTGRL